MDHCSLGMWLARIIQDCSLGMWLAKTYGHPLLRKKYSWGLMVWGLSSTDSGDNDHPTYPPPLASLLPPSLLTHHPHACIHVPTYRRSRPYSGTSLEGHFWIYLSKLDHTSVSHIPSGNEVNATSHSGWGTRCYGNGVQLYTSPILTLLISFYQSHNLST